MNRSNERDAIPEPGQAAAVSLATVPAYLPSMPYQYLANTPNETRLRLWPHNSLPPAGFVWFITGTSALVAVPLIGLIGTPVLWGLLPFLIATIAAIWFALQRSNRDRAIVETLILTPDQITLTRQGPHGKRAEWQANPHWVRITLHRTAGPVPNYLTLTGNSREVELGAFLSEPERITLAADLRQRLLALR